MTKYKLYFKDVDPDTGDISQFKEIAKLECEENTLQWIIYSLNSEGMNPNRDFYYEEISNTKEKKENSIELLNSEGPVLVAKKKTNGQFHIIDEKKNTVVILSEREIQSFIHGDITIPKNNSNGYWKYAEYPGDMKPNLKKLDEFIGIDTTDKTY